MSGCSLRGKMAASYTSPVDHDRDTLRANRRYSRSGERLPSSVTDEFWIYYPPRFEYGEPDNELEDYSSESGSDDELNDEDEDEVLGKWLVFRQYGCAIDEMWQVLTRALDSGELEAEYLNSSTVMYNPTYSGPGYRDSGVICVYTTEKLLDKVGFQLVRIVKHDIKYKTNEATNNGIYSHRPGEKRCTLKTLFWNDGKPSFECQVKNPGPPRIRSQIGQSNTAKAPVPYCFDRVYGKWIVPTENNAVTDDYHAIREELESGRLGAVRMVCPKKRSPLDDPIIIVFTAEWRMREVGCKLLNFLKRDLTFELHRRSSSSQSYSTSPTSTVPGCGGDGVFLPSTAQHSATDSSGVLRICWNDDGDPYFEKRWRMTETV